MIQYSHSEIRKKILYLHIFIIHNGTKTRDPLPLRKGRLRDAVELPDNHILGLQQSLELAHNLLLA